jgi:hypothetical protein
MNLMDFVLIALPPMALAYLMASWIQILKFYIKNKWDFSINGHHKKIRAGFIGTSGEYSNKLAVIVVYPCAIGACLYLNYLIFSPILWPHIK